MGWEEEDYYVYIPAYGEIFHQTLGKSLIVSIYDLEDTAPDQTAFLSNMYYGITSKLKNFLLTGKKRADVNKESDKEMVEPYYFTPADNKNESTLKYLIEHGLDVNKKDGWREEIPLFEVCRNRNETMV
ncbi:hypothetical protein PIROE2DRAFT_9531 [Piromyces sp. E2]|nr:hypothetical protein PIROE2DRAFT_9531 [Piromyces sp. E2]|eukprot:OUM63862.1 hypothetical protein PIROE2DRAFT_9531 [Piromyces sp. E2]